MLSGTPRQLTKIFAYKHAGNEFIKFMTTYVFVYYVSFVSNSSTIPFSYDRMIVLVQPSWRIYIG